MTDDVDDFIQQAVRANIEKECRVLGETPKPQNVLRALHLCFKYDLEVPAWVKQGFQHAYRRGVIDETDQYALDEETAEADAREATVWIEGLDRINKVLGGRGNVLRTLLGRRRAFALLPSHARLWRGLRRRRPVRRSSRRRVLRQPVGDGPRADEEPDLAAGAGRLSDRRPVPSISRIPVPPRRSWDRSRAGCGPARTGVWPRRRSRPPERPPGPPVPRPRPRTSVRHRPPCS